MNGIVDEGAMADYRPPPYWAPDAAVIRRRARGRRMHRIGVHANDYVTHSTVCLTRAKSQPRSDRPSKASIASTNAGLKGAGRSVR